jgi:hypothetical protein
LTDGETHDRSHASGKAGSISNFLFPEAGVLVSTIVIVAAFFIFFGHTSIWYDEADYLTISAAIKQTGYPFWFWDNPDKPSIFLNSPPGLFYVISTLPRLTDDLFFLRAVYATLFSVPPFIALLLYIRKRRIDLFVFYVTALYCAVTWYYVVELVQIRMDLPLASLSFLALLLVAHAEDQQGSANRRQWQTLALLVVVSALSFLIKYQAVCLTATLILSVVSRQDFQRQASWLPLTAHLAGAAIGMFVLVLLVMSNPMVPGMDVLTHTLSDNLARIGAQWTSFNEFEKIFEIVKNVLPMVIVTAVVFVMASSAGSIDWKDDRLLRLCVLMALVVVAFNIAVHRFPGAGDYYMTQAAIPLGYVFARSFGSLLHVKRSGARLLALVALLTLHAMLNVQLGWGSQQRWVYGLKDLLGTAGRLDAPKLVAANLAPFLRPDDVLLLDRWQSQSLAIAYWLNRSDRYTYLLQMDPIEAENLLERKSPGRVGALVFFGEEAQATLASNERWSGVEALLARDFVRSPQVQNAPDWTVYLRRAD